MTDTIYYVYDLDKATDSGLLFDGAPVYYLDNLEREIHGPAMGEDLDYYDGRIITLTESASQKYIFGKFFGATKIVAAVSGGSDSMALLFALNSIKDCCVKY